MFLDENTITFHKKAITFNVKFDFFIFDIIFVYYLTEYFSTSHAFYYNNSNWLLRQGLKWLNVLHSFSFTCKAIHIKEDNVKLNQHQTLLFSVAFYTLADP